MATTAETLAFEVRLKDFMTKELKRLGVASQRETAKVGRDFSRLKKTLAGVGGAVKLVGFALKAAFAAAVFMSIRGAVTTLREFSRAMSEVRTILDETTLSFDFAKQKVIDLTYTTTASGKEIAKGLYQTLSAGVTDGADAMTMLEGASKLSVGALMSVNEAVDLLTNTFNAYGMTVSEEAVTATADLMFQTVKLGKTTGPELAHSLGMVMPVASNLGVSIEELNAMLAALTLGGMDTSMAATQLRQAMVQLLNPSEDAKKLMKEYDVEISAARVSQEGFLPVLADIKDKFGDNAIAMRTLFPNIRALVGVMALAGNQFDSVNRIMEDFGGAAGSVETAVGHMRNSLDHKMKLLSASWKGFFIGMVKEMQGAVEAMSTDELERFAKSTKTVGEEFGKMIAPLTDLIPPALALMAVGLLALKVKVIEIALAFGELERHALSAAGSVLEFMGPAATKEMHAALAGAVMSHAGAMMSLKKSHKEATESADKAAIATTRMVVSYADMHGLGFMISEEQRRSLKIMEEMVSQGERLEAAAKARAEAEGLAGNQVEKQHDLYMDFLLFSNAVTKDQLKEQEEIRRTVRERNFNEEIGSLMLLTDLSVAERQRLHDHEKALHRDRQRITASSLDDFRAMKEEEARLELQGRELKLDTAFLAMIAEEEFQVLTRDGQEERIRQFKQMRDEQMQAAKAASDFAVTEAVEQEAYLMRLDKIKAKEQELVESRMDLADSWEEFGMTSSNAVASGIQGLKEWAATIGTVDQNIQQLAATAVDGFITAFLDGIEGAIDGTKTFGEAFADFGRMFLRMMAQMIMQQMVLNSLRSMFPTMGFAMGGVVAGGTGSLYPLADGGVVSGGLGRATPVKAYANGGPIVDSPHVALIGEGKHNEAVVPLPDGRSIPVDLQGASGGASVNISISAVDAAGVDELLIQRQSTLRNIIRQAMEEDRAFRQAVRQR